MKKLNLKELIEKNMVEENAALAASEELLDANDLPNKVNVIIDGKALKIIPAFTDYNMEQPKKKEKLLKQSDAGKRLDVIFHFATPQTFWKEGYTLFDRNGNPIPKDTPNVFPVCDMADSHWRIFSDIVLTNVQIHEFESVQEYAQTIGNSMLLSRGLNNVERVGYAALATDNGAYKAVFEFAKKNNVPMNTAQLYLDLQLKPLATTLMMLGKEPKTVPTLGRTPEEAQELYEQAALTFSKGGARSRYIPRVFNRLLNIKKYEFDFLMEGLRTIPANEIAMAELQKCCDKEYCIIDTLSAWLTDLKREQSKKAA